MVVDELENVIIKKLKSQQDKTSRKIMKAKMSLKIRNAFDGKVSNIVCHQLNELCGQKWTKKEIREILNSTVRSYLNEIGRKSTIEGTRVMYSSANYLLVMPKQFISTKSEQLYIWLYRKSIDESFGKINIGIDDVFDYSVVKNYYIKTKILS